MCKKNDVMHYYIAIYVDGAPYNILYVGIIYTPTLNVFVLYLVYNTIL